MSVFKPSTKSLALPVLCGVAVLTSSCVESELSQWRAEQRALEEVASFEPPQTASEPEMEVELDATEEKKGLLGFGRGEKPEVVEEEPEIEMAVENNRGQMEIVDLTDSMEDEGPPPVAESEPVSIAEVEAVVSPEPVSSDGPRKLEFKSESSSDGTMTIWLVDGNSGEKLEQLLKKSSQGLTGKVSPDGNWIVVTDQAFSELQTVHLFKKTETGSFRKIDRDSFTGTIWDQFSATQVAPHLTIQRWVTEFKGWGANSRSVDLRLAALPSKGPWIEDTYTVDLNGF